MAWCCDVDHAVHVELELPTAALMEGIKQTGAGFAKVRVGDDCENVGDSAPCHQRISDNSCRCIVQ